MKYAIIVSQKDIAGMSIKARLLELFNFSEKEIFQQSKAFHYQNISLYTVEQETIYCNHLDKEINADLFIFATKHKAESGLKCLTVHAPGNWAKADFGGFERKLCVAPALYLRKAFLKLKGSETEYEITQECTHHGPYMEKPCLFIEIGSTAEEWKDEKAAEIIAKTILYIVAAQPEKAPVAFGIGGPHYLPNFVKLIERQNIALGHVCPKYHLDTLDKEMVAQALEKTTPTVDEVILEWKGLGKEKERIIALLKEMNIAFTRI